MKQLSNEVELISRNIKDALVGHLLPASCIIIYLERELQAFGL